MGDTAWRLDHMSPRDRRVMDEQIGRFAASLSRGARKVGGRARFTLPSQEPARTRRKPVDQSTACEAC